MPRLIRLFEERERAKLVALAGTDQAEWLTLSVRIDCKHGEAERFPGCRPGRSYTTLRVTATPRAWTIAHLCSALRSLQALGTIDTIDLVCTLSRQTETERQGRGAASVLELSGDKHRATLFLPQLPLAPITELLAHERDDDFCLVLSDFARQLSPRWRN